MREHDNSVSHAVPLDRSGPAKALQRFDQWVTVTTSLSQQYTIHVRTSQCSDGNSFGYPGRRTPCINELPGAHIRCIIKRFESRRGLQARVETMNGSDSHQSRENLAPNLPSAPVPAPVSLARPARRPYYRPSSGISFNRYWWQLQLSPFHRNHRPVSLAPSGSLSQSTRLSTGLVVLTSINTGINID